MRILDVQCPHCSGAFSLYEPTDYTECFYCGRRLDLTGDSAKEAGPGDDPEFRAVFTELMHGGPEETLSAMRDYYRDTLEGPGVDMVEGLMKLADPAEQGEKDDSWDAAFEAWSRAFAAMPSSYYLPEYLEIVGMGVTCWADVFEIEPDEARRVYKPIEDIVRDRFFGDYYVVIYRHLLKGSMAYMEHSDPGTGATAMFELLVQEYSFDDPDYVLQMEKNRRMIDYFDQHPDFPYISDMSSLNRAVLDTLNCRTAEFTDEDRVAIIGAWDYISYGIELGQKIADMHLAAILEQSCIELEPNLMDRFLHSNERKFQLTIRDDVRRFYVPKDTDMSPVEYAYMLMRKHGEDVGPSSMRQCVEAYVDALLHPKNLA